MNETIGPDEVGDVGEVWEDLPVAELEVGAGVGIDRGDAKHKYAERVTRRVEGYGAIPMALMVDKEKTAVVGLDRREWGKSKKLS